MWAGGAPDVVEAIFTPGYVNHQEPAVGGGVKTVNLADWVALVEANHKAFPDLQVEFLMQAAEADRVATHWRFAASRLIRRTGADR